MCKVRFKIEEDPEREVFLAGSFNDWDTSVIPLKFTKRLKTFGVNLDIPPGDYEYKFVVDGVWKMDPCNPNWTVNSRGGLNSVVVVKER